MKFKNVLFTLIMFIVFIGSVNAAEQIATCVYKKDSETITVKLFTDYKFEVTTNFIKEYTKQEQYSTTTVKMTNNLQYNFFISDDKKFKCADEIYLNTIVQAGGSRAGSQSHTNHQISNIKQEKKVVQQSNGATTYSESVIYKNDKNSSKVNITSPSDANKEEGWLKTCNYGSTIIRFNKENVEFVSEGKPTSYSNTNPPITNQKPLIEQIKENSYACPVTLCVRGYSGAGYQITNYNFYFDYSMSGKDGCITGTEYTDAKYSCVGVNQYYTEFLDYHNKYQNTKSVDYLNKRNQSKKNLTAFCSSTLSNLNYNGTDKCVKECLEVENEIQETLKTNVNGECGFSGRLLSFFANILRWIKYILPVIVIVFGILDFMKAMGADKEDEMKKAQQRFIRRLIAAALVFIVPLILEFILDKMGFGYDSCGLF